MLELRNITKRFGAVLANDHINITVEPGTIHAIVGENGAGKSTLLKILAGSLRPDRGHLHLGGAPVDLANPRDALSRGSAWCTRRCSRFPIYR
jgi:ABC-type uncharacterized transport system ATPase subunit